MRRIKFIFLFFGFMAAGFYYGSQEDTYAHKFFSQSTGRYPANETARVVQDIWKDGSMAMLTAEEYGERLIGKAYAPLASPEEQICTAYPDIKSIVIYMMADGTAVEGAKVTLTAEIDCERGGVSPVFLKSFCSERVSYFKESQQIENTSFTFENIVDGFPRSWYVASANITLREGLSVLGIKPSQEDVKTFGKYTFECSEF